MAFIVKCGNRHILQCLSSYKKGKKAALAYELAISTTTQELYWINGPYPAGECNDIIMFQRGGLQRYLKAHGKLAIADAIYAKAGGATCTPHGKYDTKSSNMYKRRARAKMESFNGRIKSFAILSDTFRVTSNRSLKHKMAFEAVCVTVQYQMENGSPIFEV